MTHCLLLDLPCLPGTNHAWNGAASWCSSFTLMNLCSLYSYNVVPFFSDSKYSACSNTTTPQRSSQPSQQSNIQAHSLAGRVLQEQTVAFQIQSPARKQRQNQPSITMSSTSISAYAFVSMYSQLGKQQFYVESSSSFTQVIPYVYTL